MTLQGIGQGIELTYHEKMIVIKITDCDRNKFSKIEIVFLQDRTATAVIMF